MRVSLRRDRTLQFQKSSHHPRIPAQAGIHGLNFPLVPRLRHQSMCPCLRRGHRGEGWVCGRGEGCVARAEGGYRYAQPTIRLLVLVIFYHAFAGLGGLFLPSDAPISLLPVSMLPTELSRRS